MIFRPDIKVYLALGATNMRKSIDTLSILVSEKMGLDLFSGNLFALWLCYIQCMTKDALTHADNLDEIKQLALNLFDMPEPPSFPEGADEIEISSHTRKKKGPKPLPDHLPRIEVIHDLPEEEKKCACKNCEGVEDDGPSVSIARMPEQIIPKSMATPGLLAHILTAKFADALPFYRQEKQFSRIGIDLPRATMCNWAIKTAQACEIILDMMKKDIRKGPVIHIDET
jgi:transposase